MSIPTNTGTADMNTNAPNHKIIAALEIIEEAANLRETEKSLGLLRDLLRAMGNAALELKWVSDKEGWTDLEIVLNGEQVGRLVNYTKGQEYIAIRDAVFHVVEMIQDTFNR